MKDSQPLRGLPLIWLAIDMANDLDRMICRKRMVDLFREGLARRQNGNERTPNNGAVSAN
jgi:hypothetical protein